MLEINAYGQWFQLFFFFFLQKNKSWQCQTTKKVPLESAKRVPPSKVRHPKLFVVGTVFFWEPTFSALIFVGFVKFNCPDNVINGDFPSKKKLQKFGPQQKRVQKRQNHRQTVRERVSQQKWTPTAINFQLFQGIIWHSFFALQYR